MSEDNWEKKAGNLTAEGARKTVEGVKEYAVDENAGVVTAEKAALDASCLGEGRIEVKSISMLEADHHT